MVVAAATAVPPTMTVEKAMSACALEVMRRSHGKVAVAQAAA